MKTTRMDEGRVQAICEKVCQAVLKSYAETSPEAAETVKIAAHAEATNDEFHVAEFEDMCDDLADGDYIYLSGPAGSGKTHTAEQIARALGLDFYSQTTVQFAHDVRGYGDAAGKYIGTPFYEAFAHGGLYHQDEYDRSFAEAAIVLNTALANGYYDFPVIGRVYAHPKFRFMASGNTMMKGADDEYVSGQIIDASSRDRFATFYEVGYQHELELKITGDPAVVQFVEDVRNALKETGIKHVVSYRASKYMAKERCQADREKTLKRCTFKGLEVDEIRMIYGALKVKHNVWAVAMKTMF